MTDRYLPTSATETPTAPPPGVAAVPRLYFVNGVVDFVFIGGLSLLTYGVLAFTFGSEYPITMGLVSTNTTPMLLKLVAQQKLAADKFATHHFGLSQILDAYDTFGAAAETKALKVVISRQP